MKKKVVAMVTLAMFVMTLLPMAAFAGTNSEVKVNKDSVEVAMEDGQPATATIDLDFSDADKKLQAPVYVWLTKDDSNEIYRYAEFKDASPNGSKGELKGAAKLGYDKVESQKTLTVDLKEAGVYTLHAGIAYAQGDYNNRNDLGALNATGTITVTDSDVVVDTINVPAADRTEANKGGTVQFNGVPNGYNDLDVTVKVATKYVDSEAAADNEDQVVTIDNPYNNIEIVDENDDAITEVKTDSNGEAKFTVRPDATVADGYYIITLNAGDKSYDLTIKVGDEKTEVKSLEVVDTKATVVSKEDTTKAMDSVVKFVAKDENGNILTNDITGELTDTKVITEPKNNKATFKVVKVADEDAYTLKADKQAVVGDYVVRVAVKDERSYVDLKFTVKSFDEAVDIQFGDITQANHGDVTDTVVYADGIVSGSVEYVDKNGVTKEAKDAVIGIEGPAVYNPQVAGSKFSFGTQPVDGEKDAAIGSKVTVTVYDKTVKKTISKEFTVVDKNDVDAKTLAFDSETGKVQKDNTVKVTLVDKDGKEVKKNATAGKAFDYYVVSQSNADANISVTTKDQLTDGKGNINVFSDKATTAEIVVFVKVGNNVYGNTLKYTFGEQDIPADTSVVMTIGSTEMLVNNEVVDMKDAAPFIKDNRTFVPFRALGEALGANVEYVEADKTVTYKLGGTEIVMTLGDKKITVNGAEKTMDVAPFAKDGRTYVPVRFVGEGLGFNVTGLTDAQGHYVAVAFTK